MSARAVASTGHALPRRETQLGDLNPSDTGWRGQQLSLSVQNVDNREAPLDIKHIPYMTGFSATNHTQLVRLVQLSAR